MANCPNRKKAPAVPAWGSISFPHRPPPLLHNFVSADRVERLKLLHHQRPASWATWHFTILHCKSNTAVLSIGWNCLRSVMANTW